MLAQWVKNAFITWVCLVWGLFVMGSWYKGTEVPNYVWGVPGAIWFAINPTFKVARRNDRTEE